MARFVRVRQKYRDTVTGRLYTPTQRDRLVNRERGERMRLYWSNVRRFRADESYRRQRVVSVAKARKDYTQVVRSLDRDVRTKRQAEAKMRALERIGQTVTRDWRAYRSRKFESVEAA